MPTTLPFLQIAEQAARAGGEILQRHRDNICVREKGVRDLVTQADIESEQEIKQILASHFPDHGFIGEESGAHTEGDSEYCWIVDPLDGTMNYVHQLPSYCVSIGLRHRDEIIAGVVFDPVMDECFSAERQRGALINGEPIQTRSTNTVEKALVVISLSRNLARESEEYKQFEAIVFGCQGFRRLGSAALNLCYVAMGRLDAYWSVSLNVWDIAAGKVILEEAGGAIRHIDNKPFKLDDPRLLAAANDELLDQLFEIVQQQP